ncbi:hypothetical protein JXR93_13140 [bacterium]|nr:hypothetical protein [bacterium]
MKKFMIFTILSLLFLGCAEESEKKSCEDLACKEWEVCDETTVSCKAKESNCSSDSDCSYGSCDSSEHICKLNMSAVSTLNIPAGTYANEIIYNDNSLYIVNSGDNSIQKIDLTDGATNHNPFISYLEGSNPYYTTISDGKIYTANLMGNSFSVTDLVNPVDVITVFNGEDNNTLISPEGVAVTENYIYITNDTNRYSLDGDGFVSVFDKNSLEFVTKINTTQKNPQYIFSISEKIYVVNSGKGSFNNDYTLFTPQTESGVDIIDSKTNQIIKNVPFLKGGSPLSGAINNYSISTDNSKIYFGSGSASEVYSFDLNSEEFTDNTLTISQSADTNALINVFEKDGVMFAINFNTDTVYLFQNSTLFASATLRDGEFLEGAQDFAYDNINNQLYILFGISSKIRKIDLNTL